MRRIFLCLDFKAALSPFPYQEDADEVGYEEDGAILTNSHLSAWNATPMTAVSGALYFQPQ